MNSGDTFSCSVFRLFWVNQFAMLFVFLALLNISATLGKQSLSNCQTTIINCCDHKSGLPLPLRWTSSLREGAGSVRSDIATFQMLRAQPLPRLVLGRKTDLLQVCISRGGQNYKLLKISWCFDNFIITLIHNCEPRLLEISWKWIWNMRERLT